MTNLSGADWWRANQGRYPNSRDVDDLESGFRSRVEDFIGALRQAGASVIVSSTRRNPIRAHLMHYCWKVAHGEIAPADVPSKGGLNIEWVHSDLERSREAAREKHDVEAAAVLDKIEGADAPEGESLVDAPPRR